MRFGQAQPKPPDRELTEEPMLQVLADHGPEIDALRQLLLPEAGSAP